MTHLEFRPGDAFPLPFSIVPEKNIMSCYHFLKVLTIYIDLKREKKKSNSEARKYKSI